MKKCLVSHFVLGFSLVALPFFGGCTQQSASGSNPFVSSANAEPTSTENDLTALALTATNAAGGVVEAVTKESAPTNTAPAAPATNAPALAEATTAEALPPVEQKPPPNVHLSPVLSEAVKLVQSGVDESVLFTYLTNTTGYFLLGAEEIVYLNDLGVTANVITTMMQHDKALRDLRMNAWQAAQLAPSLQATQQPPPSVEPEPTVAEAPSYVEAPPMEAQPVYVSNNYFYDTLAPYGSWVYVTGYGRCWRPTVALYNPGWRPYCDRGRWVYSDCGWYWVSDYSWGATAFHYGRWFNAPGMGWCWWPDSVWAPSWVSWRYTSDYCGWAPLPPTACYQSGFGLMYNNGSVGVSFGFGLGYSDYAFVPWGTFCGPRPYQHCVPTSRAVHVYHASTPVNHLEPGGPGKVYNRGIAPDRVQQYARTEVRTVSIREQTGKGLRNEAFTRDGRTLVVHRPQFTTAASGAASFSEPSGRPGGSAVPARTSEPVVSNSPQRPATTVTPATSPVGYVNQRPQVSASRSTARPAAPLAPAGTMTIDQKPSVTTPTRMENRTAGAHGPQTEPVMANRTRTMPNTVARPAQPVNPPTSTPVVTTPSQPRVMQVTPQPVTPRATTPSRNSSIVVIGGGNNARSSGRDYSVYGTPSPSSTPSPVVNTPQIAENSPMPVTPAQPAGNWQNRGNNNYSRPENRGSYQTYSTAPPAQMNTSSPRPAAAPTYNNNSRPVQPSIPSPNYAPRPQPPVAQSAPRVESKSAPAAPQQSNPGRPAR